MRINFKKLKYRIVICIVILSIGTFLFLNKSLPLTADSPAESLRGKISSLAKSGDPIAAEMITKLDNFL